MSLFETSCQVGQPPPAIARVSQGSADCIGLCSKIEELTIEILNTKISIERPDGIPLTQTNSHHVYRVTLNNGEIWVIDPSGA